MGPSRRASDCARVVTTDAKDHDLLCAAVELMFIVYAYVHIYLYVAWGLFYDCRNINSIQAIYSDSYAAK